MKPMKYDHSNVKLGYSTIPTQLNFDSTGKLTFKSKVTSLD